MSSSTSAFTSRLARWQLTWMPDGTIKIGNTFGMVAQFGSAFWAQAVALLAAPEQAALMGAQGMAFYFMDAAGVAHYLLISSAALPAGAPLVATLPSSAMADVAIIHTYEALQCSLPASACVSTSAFDQVWLRVGSYMPLPSGQIASGLESIQMSFARAAQPAMPAAYTVPSTSSREKAMPSGGR